MDCLICLTNFTETNGKKYKCCDPRCMEYLCEDCVKRYLEIANQENLLPTCPRETCKGVFDEKCIDKSLHSLFRQTLYKHYKLSKNTDIIEAHKQDVLFTIIKEERKKFLFENMPKCVLAVSKIIFNDRINRVKKTQVKKETRFSRTCINFVCNGFLDLEFKCSKCESIFCKKCEELFEENHICNNETVESIKIVNNFVPCPHCGVKIEKAEGCMAITCAVCKNNFWYSTGEKGDHGNHGMFQSVRVDFTRRLSIEYHDYIPKKYLSHIQELENMVRKKEGYEQSLANILVRNDGKEETEELLILFSNIYSKMVRNSVGKNIANKTLQNIEKILRTRDENYTKDLETLLDSKPIIRSSIVGKDKTKLPIFIEDSIEYQSIRLVAEEMNLKESDIKKIVDDGGGVYKEFYWHYKK